MESELLDPAQGDQQVVLVHVDGLIGLAHDFEVNGIQRKLGQDAGKDGRNAHKCVQDTGDEAGQQACQQRHEQGDPDVLAGQQAHDAHCTAGAKGAVHGQIGNIQYFISYINAKNHQAPEHTLRHCSKHCKCYTTHTVLHVHQDKGSLCLPCLFYCYLFV